MFDTLKKDPKTFILFILAIMIGVLGLIGCMLYLTMMTRHETEGWHFAFGITGIFFLVIMFWLIVKVIVHVSALQTKHDWKEEREEAIEKERYQLERTQMEVVSKWLEKKEVFTPEELTELARIEQHVLQKKSGEQP